MKIAFFWICLIVLFPGTAMAQIFDVQATGEYVMGDNDTKLEARKIAMEHAKRLAVEQIGTYLESEKVVNNGILTKNEIKTFAAAVIRTSVLHEKLLVVNDKTSIFTLKINASVDLGVLDEKVKELKVDSKRAEQIKMLQNQNSILLKELESLSLQLKDEKAAGYKGLRQKREALLDEIASNQNTMKTVFVKGTLLNLAMKDKNEINVLEGYVDDAFQFIADNTKFVIGAPQVRYKDTKVDLLIDVEWQVQKLDEVLKKLLPFYKNPRVDSSGDITMSPEHFIGNNADALYKYCKTKSILLNVEAGQWSQSDIIALGQSDEVVTKNKQTFVFFDIPIDKLNEITGLSAKIIVR